MTVEVSFGKRTTKGLMGDAARIFMTLSILDEIFKRYNVKNMNELEEWLRETGIRAKL